MHKVTRQEISRQRLDMISCEEMRKNYVMSREAYKNSPEGLAEAAKRQEAQKKYYEEEKARMKNVNLLADLKKYLLAHIVADLDLSFVPEQNKNIDEEAVDRVMTKYQANLDYLKEACLKYEKVGKNYGTYLYISLYRDLIDLNPVFVRYSPIEVFYQTSVGSKLPAGVMAGYKDLFQSKGFFKDEQFLKANARYFTGISNISTMTDFDQIKKEIKADPSLFAKLQPVVRHTFLDSDVAVKNILHIAPMIVAYMTEEEIIQATENCCALMGNLLVKYPDLIKILPANYFKRFSAKALFARTSRADVHNSLKRYYDTIPELKKYMNKYVEQLNEQSNEFSL